MSSDLESWYTSAFESFKSICSYRESARTYFFENKEKLGLTTATSVFSIGPGDGGIDAFLLTDCMPNLKSYCGVDVDSHGLALFQSRIDEAHLDKTIKIRLVNGDVTEWDDYTGGADVIFIFHVLYYMHDYRKRIQLLQRCAQWLNPGGRIILQSRGFAYDDPFYLCAKKFGVEREHYIDTNLKEDLQAAGLTRIHMEEAFAITLNLKNRGKPLLNFFMFKDAREEEAKALDDYFEEVLPPGKMIELRSVVLSVKKEDFTTNE